MTCWEYCALSVLAACLCMLVPACMVSRDAVIVDVCEHAGCTSVHICMWERVCGKTQLYKR